MFGKIYISRRAYPLKSYQMKLAEEKLVSGCLIGHMVAIDVVLHYKSASPVGATQKFYRNTQFQSTKWEINGLPLFYLPLLVD